MAARAETAATRDRAILIVRLATAGAVGVAVALSWAFSNLAETFFSGKPAAAPAPPQVPVANAPQQQPRTVIQTVHHHPAASRPGTGTTTNPRPPSTGPAPAPPPAPPPACHSTPTKPC